MDNQHGNPSTGHNAAVASDKNNLIEVEKCSSVSELAVKNPTENQNVDDEPKVTDEEESTVDVNGASNLFRSIIANQCDDELTAVDLMSPDSEKNLMEIEKLSNPFGWTVENQCENPSADHCGSSNSFESIDYQCNNSDDLSMATAENDSTKIENSSNPTVLTIENKCDSNSSNNLPNVSAEENLSQVEIDPNPLQLITENQTYNQNTDDNLLIAIARRNFKKVKKIINFFGLSHNPSWLNGYTPLRIAIRKKCKQIAIFLLNKNAEVNRVDQEPHDTPLHLAINRNYYDIVDMLLKKEADINKLNLLGKSPLDIAIERNDIIIFELFVKYISDTSITNDNYIKLLVNLFDKDCVELIGKLLTKCLHIDFESLKSANFLCKAIEKDYHHSIIENLLARGVDVNYIDSSYFTAQTSLYIACEKGNHQLVQLLLSKGADTNIKQVVHFETVVEYYPIHIAIKGGHYLTVKTLLDHGADANKMCLMYGNEEFSPLHLACNFCQLQIVTLLLSRGAEINIKNNKGLSPISIAAKRGYYNIFKYLINHDNFYLDCDNARSILHSAVKSNLSEILMLVIDYINELDPKDKLRYEVDTNSISNLSGLPLLHTAARFDSDHCIDILVQFGAYVDFKDQDGRTPLHFAYQYGRQKSVVSLIKNGANINAICRKGYTPFEYSQVPELVRSSSYEGESSAYDYEEVYQVLDEYTPEIIKSYFANHIAMMKIINLYVNEKNYDALIAISSENENLFQQQNEYENEVENMKNKIISGTITYYNFVRASLNQSIMYLNHENFVNTLRSGNYNSMFPNYSIIIDGRFRKALARKKLLDEVDEYPTFDIILELPYPCVSKIIDYLSNDDLKTLINKCKFSINDNDDNKQ
ncbi:ankyrin-1-like [Microplitis mediator]|uniref:ankyrin-1-like n=1 Tax=Microplitis mediator TaxID=375433 RepID=UPI00255794D5|nr:ankyrin-1-like [Microplitis mediator]